MSGYFKHDGFAVRTAPEQGGLLVIDIDSKKKVTDSKQIDMIIRDGIDALNGYGGIAQSLSKDEFDAITGGETEKIE